MSMPLIGLSRDHVGKHRAPFDRGAAVDVDGDGDVEPDEHEAWFTGQYLLVAEARLVQLGYPVRVYSDGDYPDRHARATADGCTAYIAGHINALKGRITPTSGDYGSVFYDHRTTAGGRPNGLDVARAIRDQLQRKCPELAKVFMRAAAPNNDWHRAYSTIAGLGSPIGICYEPFFLDQADHQPLLQPDGIRRVGLCLADGIHAALSRPNA